MNSKIKKRFFTLNIALLLCGFVCLVCYDNFRGLWLKGFTSFWFALLGLTNLVYAKKSGIKLFPFTGLVFTGLVFGMCADVLLAVNFMLGIIFFAAGHLLYLIAFCRLEKLCIRDMLIIIPLAAVSLFVVTGTPYITISDPFIKKLLLGYAVVIACMLSKAISNFIAEKTFFRLLIALGSVMFWFSDIMLAIDMFGTPSRLVWILCSYSYWPAQLILAFSLYHYTNDTANNRHIKAYRHR